VGRAVAQGLDPALGAALASFFDPRAATDTDAQRIEARRAALAASPAVYTYVPVSTPHGPARVAVEAAADAREPNVTLRWLAVSASVPPAWGRLLRRCADAAPRGIVLELGALAGISGAYLALGRGCARLVTIEGSPVFARVAAETFSALGLDAEVRHAIFDEGLRRGFVGAPPSLGLAYVDGHHDGAAMRAYVRMLTPALLPAALVVLDDITQNRGMWEAWQAFGSEAGWSAAVHMGRFGVLKRAAEPERPLRFDFSRYTGRWPIGTFTPTAPLPPDSAR